MQEEGFMPAAGQSRAMKKQHPARLQGMMSFHPLGEQAYMPIDNILQG
jgi:ureidoglycolate hydrolase